MTRVPETSTSPPMQPSMADFAAEQLAQLARCHRDRSLRVITSLEVPYIEVGSGNSGGSTGTSHGQAMRLVDFASNDYLGFSAHPALATAARTAIEAYGTSSRASRLICGTLEPHYRLEQELVSWSGFPSATVFNSGYDANLGVLSALLGRHDVLFMDKQCHASLVDGARMSGCTLKRYGHGNLDQLSAMLDAAQRTRQPGQKWVLCTDSLFSMSGHCADLPALQALAEAYDAWLLLDEAHSVGVYGPKGRGLWTAQGLVPSNNLMVMGTFSKALGSSGAFVLGPAGFDRYLINTCRSLIYTTALPASVVAACRAAVALVAADPAVRQTRLWDNIETLNQRCGLDLAGPIVYLNLGDEASALAAAKAAVETYGLLVVAIRPPTVPDDGAGCRVALSAMHEANHLETLAQFMTAYQ
ncbi:MAG: 8-amino-7-oxononanoate synthase [Cyanobacteria bacterium HKST-UBA06]|nr:8-amino-7-oxononanoate synthase [Cyanobacteria bacterium HKST-UBA06]